MPKWEMPKYRDYELLPNIKPMTETEFAQSGFFMHPPRVMFTAKVVIDRTQHYAQAFVAYDGTGYAIVGDYHGKKVTFWRFGVCMHEEKTRRNVGNCLNEYTCTKCGFAETIDSSG